MNIKELDKKHNVRKMTGHVSAMMKMSIADFRFESYFLHGNTNNEHRYINASSQNGEHILFVIPAGWGQGPHILTPDSNVIRFEPGKGLPNDPESWYAQRGELFITNTSETSFSGTFNCYRYTNEDKPALIGGTFMINFTSIAK
ncbi:hypothetical protein ACVWYU_005625 [Pseudomonas sp. TE12234]